MSNTTFGLVSAVLLIASPAMAQSSAAPDAPPAAPSAAIAKAAPAGPTVSGVVVEALPKKTCSSRDKTCIAIVVAELKEHYPEQLKAFCMQWRTRAIQSEWVTAQLNESLGSNNPPTPPTFGVNSAVSKACSPDKPSQK